MAVALKRYIALSFFNNVYKYSSPKFLYHFSNPYPCFIQFTKKMNDDNTSTFTVLN